MASSLCACPALFFKIIILCVCSELLQRLFQALAERLKPISLRDVPHSFHCPRCDAPPVTPPRLGTFSPTHTLTQRHISRSHCPLPAPLPSLFFFSSHPYKICRKFPSQAFPHTHLQGNLGKLLISLEHFLFRRFAIPPWTKCTNLRFIRRRLVPSGEKFNSLCDPSPAHCAPPGT